MTAATRLSAWGNKHKRTEIAALFFYTVFCFCLLPQMGGQHLVKNVPSRYKIVQTGWLGFLENFAQGKIIYRDTIADSLGAMHASCQHWHGWMWLWRDKTKDTISLEVGIQHYWNCWICGNTIKFVYWDHTKAFTLVLTYIPQRLTTHGLRKRFCVEIKSKLARVNTLQHCLVRWYPVKNNRRFSQFP